MVHRKITGKKYKIEIQSEFTVHFFIFYFILVLYLFFSLRVLFNNIQESHLLPKSAIPDLGPVQPPVQWIPGILFPGMKRLGHEAYHSCL